jgi:MFS family permease
VLWPRGGLWRHEDFLRLWGAQAVSHFGSQVTLLALPLVAVLTLEASAFEVSALGAAEFAPFLLFTLAAGVWVDRVRRRPLLIAADVARAAVLASVPIAYAFDAVTIWQLYAVGFAHGVFTVVFDVAYVPFVASLVARQQLLEANAKVEISRSAAQTAGPGIAGVLVQTIGAPLALLADAVSFLFSALLAWRIRVREEILPRAARGRAVAVSELLAGLEYVLRHPYLRPLAACTALSNFFGAMVWGPLLLVFAVRELGLEASTIGAVLTVGGVGVVLGSFVVGRLSDRFGIGRTAIGAAVLLGPVLLLIPLAPRSSPLPFLIVPLLVTGFGGVVYNVTLRSLAQSITPNRLLGRATAVTRTIVWGVIPLGNLTGGALASVFGVRGALWVGAIGASFAFVPVLLSPVRSLVEMPEPQGA